MQAYLHEHAHEEGGYGCQDAALIDRQRGVIVEVMKGIGKNLLSGNFDILKLSLPVALFEPRSYLEKLTDPWVYPHFLDNAAAAADPIERLKWVTTWIIGGFHIALSRFEKPFNPILGETWQASLPDGCRVYLEQISHHPPISAFQLIGPNRKYEFYGLSQPSVSYKTNGLKTSAKGKRQLKFKDGVIIDVDYPHYYIKSLLTGSAPRAEVGGKATFIDAANNLRSEVTFGKHEGGFIHPHLYHRNDAVQGAIYKMIPADRPLKQAPQAASTGWGGGLSLSKIGRSFSLVSGSGSDDENAFYGTLEKLATCKGNWLSHLEWQGERYWSVGDHVPLQWIPDAHPLPSDSRYREDLSALKSGDVRNAQKHKEELENAQRADARLRKEGRSTK